MSTVPAFEAFIDGAIADPGLTKSDAGDLITPFGVGISGLEARDWLDAIAVQYESIGTINNPTYSALRNEIVNEGKATSMALFTALEVATNLLPETRPIHNGVMKVHWRSERDQINDNIVTLRGFKAGQNRQVKEALELGVDKLVEYKEQVLSLLKGLGDV